MRSPRDTAARGRRECDHALGSDGIDQQRRADDVDDRVDGAHLVELDFLGRDAVDPSLRLREEREGALGQLGRARRQAGTGDELADDPVGPMGMRLARSAHLGVQRADPRQIHFTQLQLRTEAELLQALVERRPGRAQVKERGDEHVARHAPDRIEDQHLHAGARSRRCAWRAIRAATKPAPKPLSMLTTETLAAQELSIARSAAMPPSEAP